MNTIPVAQKIEFADETTIAVPCRVNGTYRITVDTADFLSWLEGASLEEAFPYLSAPERNVLIGGPTPALLEATAREDDENTVPESPEDQAIAEFMREREELKLEATGWREVAKLINDTATEIVADAHAQIAALKEEVRRVSDKAERQRGALNGLTRLHDENTAIILQASRYVGQARELLGELGIVVETDENGYPSLSVDLPAITNKLAEIAGI
ncbi:hypothetical protein BSL82_03855 [Tardibacter chloracetimidivorans]|uniref:Uncharacterized protein n=1 Tax=Tardibacter chloracetimidivorans TaxID=1921510 RepID=A0A1L3ZSE7_9SPHN|nr:hypothetical protein [Tardibacter chloracetimidivorans]API58552.1 hypothetical protein BSL82_03855 [Tardibacter chloracetimidivorans]